MQSSLESRLREELEQISESGNLRKFTHYDHQGKYIMVNNQRMLNLSSNDYLGIASDSDIKESFLAIANRSEALPTSSSSRLLSGNFPEFEELEALLSSLYDSDASLVLNCGYHANTGILPTISTKNTLILADKLVHASLIDGLRLCEAKYIRYRHNDYTQLEELVSKYSSEYDEVIVVVESVYSMDGDITDLQRLVEIKKNHPQMMLYVDEAHGVGCFGDKGLGVAEEQGCIKDIDFLVGTFGKALASVGAFLICSNIIKQYLINKMRPLIFTTAMPPINAAWCSYIMRKSVGMGERRKHLKKIEARIQSVLLECGINSKIESQIVPIIGGDATDTIKIGEEFKRKGFLCSVVRPPTVPVGTSRLRLSLMANLEDTEVDRLCEVIKDVFNNR